MNAPSALELPQPVANVVLYQPEIPQNTGNIGRTCVAVGAKLWIVRPASFDFSDTRVKRAGLDYWQYLDKQAVDDWSEIVEQLPVQRMFFFSRFGEKSIFEQTFEVGDVFVFGKESAGLPSDIMAPDHPNTLRLPTLQRVRSLNLATTAGIVLYEQQRQLLSRFSGEQR